MFHLDAITNENNKDDDKKWSYRMLIIGPSGSGKTNALLNQTLWMMFTTILMIAIQKEREKC